MNRRIVTLILSFICCGLGQVYKGEVLKGINFIVIYTFLIVSFFFYSSTSLLHFLVLSSLLLMWVLGMLDAYIDDKILIRGVIWQTLLAIFSGTVISGAIITFLVVGIQTFPAMDKRLVADARIKAIPDAQGLDNIRINLDKSKEAKVLYPRLVDDSQQSGGKNQAKQSPGSSALTQSEQNKVEEVKVEPPVDELSIEVSKENSTSQQNVDTREQQMSQPVNSSKPAQIEKNEGEKAKSEHYFSIQVGAFSEKSRAENLADQLRKKKYFVNVIEPSLNENPMKYKVKVGKFKTRDAALKMIQKLKNEKLNMDMMVISF